jgi:hypothetical protein
MKRTISKEQITILKSVLKQELGRTWPLFLLSCLLKKKSLFSRTRWAKNSGAETEFVKRFSMIASVYSALIEKSGREKAFSTIKQIVVPVGCSEQWAHFNSLALSQERGMGRLMKFHNLMDRKGAPQFNTRDYIKRTDTTCHFIITRCVFNDFFTEVKYPELTKLFCEVDTDFFPYAFPEFSFHRDGSLENTIAYGKDHCEFIFEKKEYT